MSISARLPKAVLILAVGAAVAACGRSGDVFTPPPVMPITPDTLAVGGNPLSGALDTDSGETVSLEIVDLEAGVLSLRTP